MGTGFKHGAGGSNPLNFKVIGSTTAPSNPKENTIWVNTSTTITNYVFSATQPTGSAGMVWITTGTSSTVAFNALKKNGIQVYPISAKQYIGGAWADKTAKSWQGGAWVDWVTYLYVNGNDCTNITGGWQAANGRTDGYSNTGTCTVKSDSFTLSISNQQASSITRITKNKVDISKMKRIAINVTAVKNSGAYLFVSSTNNTTNSSMAAKCELTKTGIHYLDISKVNGTYYVGVQMINTANEWTERQVTVNAIYME